MRPLVLLSGLAPGGAEQVTVDFLGFLARAGRPVPVCTLTDRLDGPPALDLAAVGVARYDLGGRRLSDARALRRLVALVRGQGFDLVHAHGQDAAILAHAARRFVPFAFLVTRHVLEEPARTLRERLRARLALGALRGADAPVAVSRAAADRLEALGSFPPGRIRVIRNGVALERFRPDQLGRRRVELRETLRARPGDFLLLVPAVLRADKGHRVLLEVVPYLLGLFPGIQVAVAGSGEMEGELRARAAHLGGTVQFLGHRVDIPELMDASDLVVLPSLAEALPTVAMEAAAAGRAVVATRVGGTPEVVEDGVTGLLVPPGDAQALAQAIMTVLRDAEGRAAMGVAARQRAHGAFGIEAQVSRTLRLWGELAGNGGEFA
jgi:glycosyltransferase involved in cell wall biosynthesis